MMSRAKSEICVSVSILSRSAAFCMIEGSVAMPTVKMLGTSIRIFCLESALLRSTAIESGVKSINVYFWKKGHTKDAPP